MKIEVGKFYRRKHTGSKLICLVNTFDEIGSPLFWDTKSFGLINLPKDEIEEWREPMTKNVWVYLTKNGVVFTSDEDTHKLRVEGIQFIGAKKVTLVEGVWE